MNHLNEISFLFVWFRRCLVVLLLFISITLTPVRKTRNRNALILIKGLILFNHMRRHGYLFISGQNWALYVQSTFHYSGSTESDWNLLRRTAVLFSRAVWISVEQPALHFSVVDPNCINMIYHICVKLVSWSGWQRPFCSTDVSSSAFPQPARVLRSSNGLLLQVPSVNTVACGQHCLLLGRPYGAQVIK